MMPETAEQVCEQPDVKKELARSGRNKAPKEEVKAQTRDKFWFFTHALLLIGLIALEWVLRLKLIPIPQTYFDVAQRWTHAAILGVIMLAIAKAISVYLFGRIEDVSTRFSLKRIEHLIVGVILAVIAVSAVFVNWYPALTALGVGSIILGLAVQTPGFGDKLQVTLVRDLKFDLVPDVGKERPGIIPHHFIEHFFIWESNDSAAGMVT
jgi:hypothetical protein